MPIAGIATAGYEDEHFEWISMRTVLTWRDHTGLAVSQAGSQTSFRTGSPLGQSQCQADKTVLGMVELGCLYFFFPLQNILATLA